MRWVCRVDISTRQEAEDCMDSNLKGGECDGIRRDRMRWYRRNRYAWENVTAMDD